MPDAAALKPVLTVSGLHKRYELGASLFSRRRASVKALEGVDFEIYPGEILGLVGESGCGKSTLGRLILRLIEATEGELIFEGRDLRGLSLDPAGLFRPARCRAGAGPAAGRTVRGRRGAAGAVPP